MYYLRTSEHNANTWPLIARHTRLSPTHYLAACTHESISACTPPRRSSHTHRLDLIITPAAHARSLLILGHFKVCRTLGACPQRHTSTNCFRFYRMTRLLQSYGALCMLLTNIFMKDTNKCTGTHTRDATRHSELGVTNCPCMWGKDQKIIRYVGWGPILPQMKFLGSNSNSLQSGNDYVDVGSILNCVSHTKNRTTVA